MENGFTFGYDKYNWEEKRHFITEDLVTDMDFGEPARNIYAFPGTEVLIQKEREVQLAANGYGDGRSVYIGGLPYSANNARLLHRAILWCCHAEAELYRWFSINPLVEVHAYPANGRYCVSNNSYEAQETVIYDGNGNKRSIQLDGGELRWFEIA
jgi:1,3-beta-galactosyl-N-acetylhexosamine phosphorylase